MCTYDNGQVDLQPRNGAINTSDSTRSIYLNLEAKCIKESGPISLLSTIIIHINLVF